MTVRLAIIMDEISTLSIKKDSSIALLQEASKRSWELAYLEQQALFCKDAHIFANLQPLTVLKHDTKATDWYQLGEKQCQSLHTFDVVLMRKDPPFDLEYIVTTYLLDKLVQSGVLVLNHPQALRDTNEKCSISWFPQCCPPFLITRQKEIILAFLEAHQDIIVKPLNSMGGHSIFRVRQTDPNVPTILDLMTDSEKRSIMVQKYIAAIMDGDKRIFLIHGEPVPYALARIPKSGDYRGNLVAGAIPVVQPLTERDQWIAQEIGPILREKGLLFVGIDVIGDYLTEINVTSPTGIRELEAVQPLGIAGLVMDQIEKLLVLSCTH